MFTVDSFEPGENNSTITINYVLQPFKKARRLSDEEWIWDPFDLDYGITMNRLFKDVEVNIPIPESGGTQEWDEYDISDYVKRVKAGEGFVARIPEDRKVITPEMRNILPLFLYDEKNIGHPVELEDLGLK